MRRRLFTPAGGDFASRVGQPVEYHQFTLPQVCGFIFAASLWHTLQPRLALGSLALRAFAFTLDACLGICIRVLLDHGGNCCHLLVTLWCTPVD